MSVSTAEQWLSSFASACRSGDSDAMAALFTEDALWRDYLAFDLTLQTLEGQPAIANFASKRVAKSKFAFEPPPSVVEPAEASFFFTNALGHGRGYLRLDSGRCKTLFTSLQSLSHELSSNTNNTDDPYVLIVGGGQCGLALGAQLANLDVPYLIIDRYPNVGDQWRSRYDSLVLHDPVWYDHLPFKPFPESWPVFTPKDQMGDFLDAYADELSLNIQTGTELINASYDQNKSVWTAVVKCEGGESEIHATHLVMALGLSGFPYTPDLAGQDEFTGLQVHSSQYKPSKTLAGKQVVVIGANNSAHDIAADLVQTGAKPVMLQRSSTLVVKQSVYCEKLLGKLYSEAAVERGITADEADFLFLSVPMRLLEERHRELWKTIAVEDASYYKSIEKSGFTLDFAADGAGLGLKYRRTASGYYIDVGASKMVVDGQIKVLSGVNVKRLTANQVQLDTGESINADGIVYATGYGNMIDWVKKLIGTETANKVGPCWGYGSGTKGDPKPWIGELRNMWMPTSQEGLWFMGGNLAQARYFSGVLALQLQLAYLELSYE